MTSRRHSSRGVIYLLTGPAHGARMVVSIASLRQHYRGPITVYTTHDKSHDIGRLCAADHRLGVEHRRFFDVASPKNSAFLTKLALLPFSPYDTSIYLDADTMVVGDISPLFENAAATGFCATQFANWTSSTRVIRRRIKAWSSINQARYSDTEWKRLIDRSLQPHPAVNGGVFGFRRDSPLLFPWLELALIGRRTFICDEIALQIMLADQQLNILDSRFNSSPIYATNRTDVRVWHFHGEKHVRKDSCRTLWMPAFDRCVAESFAGVQRWALDTDRRLAGYLAQNPTTSLSVNCRA